MSVLPDIAVESGSLSSPGTKMSSYFASRAGSLPGLRPLLCLAALLPLVAALGACSQKASSAAEKKAAAGPAIPVIVASVATKTVPLRVEAIGNVEPYRTVSVKARVDGQIVKVFF